MKWLKKKVRRARAGVDAYKSWRAEALGMIESEVGKDSWALLPAIKEIHTLPYIGMKWIGGSKA